ncbi:MAG: hypothetical protein R2798_06830 [Chitinophagales bacterium]
MRIGLGIIKGKYLLRNFEGKTMLGDFFIFFACPKKTKQKKRHFFSRYFALAGQNRSSLAKFFPRLQKFLTPKNCYTAKKDFSLFNTQ